MKLARSVLVFAVAVGMFCGISLGQVLKQVPSNAWVVIKISNLQATNTKVAALAKLLGIDQMQADMADPLSAALAQGGLSQGVDTKGDMAVAIMDFSGGASPNVVMLLPVSDYKTFLTNWTDAKTEGDITTVTLKNDVNPSYVANWGSYAAMSPSKELLSAKPGGLTVGEMASKELDGKDFVVLANLKVMRPMIFKGLDDAQTTAGTQIDNAANQGNLPPNFAPFVPLIKIGLTQVLDFAKGFMTDADTATLSANLGSDGVALTEMVEFATGSTWGNRIAGVKNTDATLLAGLPQGKYLFFGGSQSDPRMTSEILSNLLDPIVKETTTMGDQGKAIADLITSVKLAASTETAGAFGMVAPSGQLGVQPLLQFLTIRHGNAKTLSDAQHKLFDAQQALIKSLAAGGAAIPVTTFTASAKTVGGVAFDQYQTPIAAEAQTPQEMQTQMMMKYMFGADGNMVYTGMVNDNTLLGVCGLPDETILAAVNAIKAEDDPMAKTATVKSVAAQLPSKRLAVAYVPLDELFTTVLTYAKASGMDMGVKMPEDLPPIGITVAGQGTAVRIDGYVPSQLLQAVTAASMQVYMNMSNRGGQAAPAPAPGL